MEFYDRPPFPVVIHRHRRYGITHTIDGPLYHRVGSGWRRPWVMEWNARGLSGKLHLKQSFNGSGWRITGPIPPNLTIFDLASMGLIPTLGPR